MHAFFIALAAIFGLIIGSFLNVVALRLHTGRGIGGRSHCMSCGRTLRWYELVPVFSFLVQRGRCRHCSSRISWQYPLVEALTALLFAGVAVWVIDPVRAVVWMIIVSLGMIIAIYDVRHRMIAIEPLIGLCIGALALRADPVGLVAVPAIFLAVWALSRGRLIGFGDIELMGVIGLSLGVVSGFSALMLGFWIACAVMLPIVVIARMRQVRRNPQIPLGPFLLIGWYLVGVVGLDILTSILRMVQ
jgi:leader peptidase (prepilin peptidase)/N-methyltransferase